MVHARARAHTHTSTETHTHTHTHTHNLTHTHSHTRVVDWARAEARVLVRCSHTEATVRRDGVSFKVPVWVWGLSEPGHTHAQEPRGRGHDLGISEVTLQVCHSSGVSQ